jgi:hypothetical protein
MTPLGMYINASRLGAAIADDAADRVTPSTCAVGVIASNHGSATAATALFKTVRRVIGFMVV